MKNVIITERQAWIWTLTDADFMRVIGQNKIELQVLLSLEDYEYLMSIPRDKYQSDIIDVLYREAEKMWVLSLINK